MPYGHAGRDSNFMPSIHKQPGKPNWFCAFSVLNPETRRNKRLFRSTKTTDKKQALEICRAWHKPAQSAQRKVERGRRREVIARGVGNVFT
jgi:hypothetical protein